MRTLASLLQEYAEVVQGGDVAVSGIAMDSRTAAPGSLFLACRGIGTHGLQWAGEALDRGAVAVAWEPQEGMQPSFPAGAISIAVPDLRARASAIASRYFDEPSMDMEVVGVTGTNGKTSVTHLLAQALGAVGRPCGLVGTLGYGFPEALERISHTTPDAVTVQRLLAALRDQGAVTVAMEVSSHALDQDRVSGVRFRAAAFTNLTRDHLDYHADLHAYGEAKRRLFQMQGLEAAVVDIDDAFGREILAGLPSTVRPTTVGGPSRAHEARFVRIEEVSPHGTGLSVRLDTHAGDMAVETRLLGGFNAVNLAITAGLLLELGVTAEEAATRLSAAQTVPGRMEAFGGDGTPLVVVDYAHTPDALEQVLKAARTHTSGRLWCVFGCGGERDRGKRPMMAAVAAAWADCSIVTDDNQRGEDAATIVADIVEGFPATADWSVEHDRATAIARALNEAVAGDSVVVAGKGHEAYQIIGSQMRPFDDRASVLSLLAGGAG